MIIESLQSIGLNDKQIQVYLANLKLGAATANVIASEAKLNRTSTYDILSALEKQGFITYTITAGKRSYQALRPKHILGLLREKQKLVQKALPELEALETSVVKKPKIEVYAGVNGIRSVFEDVLENGKNLRCFSSLKPTLRLFKYYFPHFVEERIRRGIKIRLLIDAKPLDETAPYKILKKNTKTLLWAYDGRVMMISLEEKEPVGILIKEKNFFHMQKVIFDLLWEALPEP